MEGVDWDRQDGLRERYAVYQLSCLLAIARGRIWDDIDVGNTIRIECNSPGIVVC